MSCPNRYCTSGFCLGYSAEEREALKARGREYIRDGAWLIGLRWVAVAMLIEDGEAEGYVDVRTGEYRHRLVEVA